MIVIYFAQNKNPYCFNCAKKIVDDVTARAFEEENSSCPFVSYRKVICTYCKRLIGYIKII